MYAERQSNSTVSNECMHIIKLMLLNESTVQKKKKNWHCSDNMGVYIAFFSIINKNTLMNLYG